MLCQNCNERTATVHLTKIVNGEKTEVYLCEQCARDKGEFNFAAEPFSIHNLLAGLFSPELQPSRNFVTQPEEQCETCGMSFREFGQVGRFGCADCYEAFEPRLTQMMRRIHGSEQHTGKVPERQGKDILLRKEINQLRNQLQEAIAKEEFERAAELRDKIYGLERRNKAANEGGEL